MDDINLIYETYHLPEIEKDGLTEVEYNHRCKYLRLYIRLIKRCQSMTDKELSGYNEVHHILPRCLNGEDEESNLLEMPVRYHIMAHIVLFEAYSDSFNVGYAAYNMVNGWGTIDRKTVVLEKFSTRTISKIRENFSKNMSIRFSGENNPMYGKRGELSPNYGKPLSEDRRRKISNSLKGRKMPEDIKQKISNSLKGEKAPNFGKVLSEETKRKISDNHADFSGGKNGRSIKVIGPGGVIFDCAKDAAKSLGINYSTFMNWLKWSKNNHGWSFLKENNE